MAKDWYKVENLQAQQEYRKKQYEKGEKDSKNDFDSYRMLNEGLQGSEIENHNATGDAAQNMAVVIKRIVMKNSALCSRTIKIADLGGGVGFIANALSQEIKDSIIYSYDIAEEATKYGTRHFKKVHFINKGIHINEILEEGKFDVILANEFYPFTRNADWDYQKSYVQTCINNLNESGILIIGITDKKDCLLDNYLEMKDEFKGYQVSKHIIPYAKVMKICGGRGNFMLLAQIVSKVIKGKRQLHYFIVLQK